VKTANEIVELFNSRKRDQDPMIGHMREMRLAYNGDLPVVLPTLDANERPFTANLIAQGLDQIAMRVASVLPNVHCPPDQPGKPRAEDYAQIRRNAILGWWNANEMDLKMRRRARHLIGYGTSPVILRPDFNTGLPTWQLASPLHTYPGPVDNPDDMVPPDAIFAYRRPWSWLKATYPAKVNAMAAGMPAPDERFDVLEYIDANESVLIAVGKPKAGRTDTWGNVEVAEGPAPIAELDRVPNRIGRPMCVVPGRITLDRPGGKFDGMIGIYMQQAKLMALEVIAVQRSVFPEKWLEARPNELPAIVIPANAQTGAIGVLKGGVLQVPQLQPGFQVQPMLDRLAAEMRSEGGLPSDLSGQSATNVRTGRRGENLLSSAIDFPIQEFQNIFERSLQHEDEVAQLIVRDYALMPKKAVMVGWGGPKVPVAYETKHFADSVANSVDFGLLGGDLNEQTVMWGQLLGTEVASVQTVRENHPAIEDPEAEHARVTFEQLEKSLLMEVAQPGSFSLPDKARVMELVATQKIPVYAAIMRVQKEAQDRQATAGPPGAPTGPTPPGAPGAQPGIAPPGMGAEAGTGPQGSLPPLAQFMSSLHGVGAAAGPGG